MEVEVKSRMKPRTLESKKKFSFLYKTFLYITRKINSNKQKSQKEKELYLLLLCHNSTVFLILNKRFWSHFTKKSSFPCRVPLTLKCVMSQNVTSCKIIKVRVTALGHYALKN